MIVDNKKKNINSIIIESQKVNYILLEYFILGYIFLLSLKNKTWVLSNCYSIMFNLDLYC